MYLNVHVQCLLLPSEVVPEDIISIKGQQVEIASKEWPAPADGIGLPPQESSKQWIDLKQEKSVMFLDSWEVKEAEKGNKVHVCTCTILETQDSILASRNLSHFNLET